MTETSPRWRVSYKSKQDPASEPQTLVIASDSMVSAIKQAQMKLADLDGGPWHIFLVESLPLLSEPGAGPVDGCPACENPDAEMRDKHLAAARLRAEHDLDHLPGAP